MEIQWCSPAYSAVKIDSVRALLEARQQVAIDRTAPLKVQLTIGSHCDRVDTSGLATFYKAMKGFLEGLSAGVRAVLIIDDDDAFHVLCEPIGTRYTCSLRRGGREIAVSEEGASTLSEGASAYLTRYEAFLSDLGLGAVKNL